MKHRLKLILCAIAGHDIVTTNKGKGAPMVMSLALKGHRPLPCAVCVRCKGAWVAG